MKVRYGYRQHRGGLQESLQTKVYISVDTFKRMLDNKTVEYYAFDERCNQVLYINWETYTWYFIEIQND